MPLPSQKAHLDLRTAGWILAVCFICFTFIPRSFDNTLFVDGLAYAAISRNMAAGLGTFWEPYFADTFWLPYNNLCSFFCDNPPLMFVMESVLFRIFGDTIAVENTYNTIVLLVSIWLIHLIWGKLFKKNPEIKRHSWLPVLLWYAIRIVWWAMPNNLLDTTMAAFCMASCYFQLGALSVQKGRNIKWVFAGLMIVLACLTKGPVGLFPLVFPVIYVMIYGRFFLKTALAGLAIVLITVFASFVPLMLYKPSGFFLTSYFEGQVMAALLQKRERVVQGWTAHIYLVKLLLVNLLPHSILLLALFVLNKYLKTGVQISISAKKSAWLAGLIVISIILPMLVSVKQADYYLMPALPFTAIFFAAYMLEFITSLSKRANQIVMNSIVSLAFILVISMVYNLLNPETDRNYEIAKALAKHVPPRSLIWVNSEHSRMSVVHTPFQRYARLSASSDIKDSKYMFFDFEKDKLMLDSITKNGSFKIIDLGLGAKLGVKKD